MSSYYIFADNLITAITTINKTFQKSNTFTKLEKVGFSSLRESSSLFKNIKVISIQDFWKKLNSIEALYFAECKRESNRGNAMRNSAFREDITNFTKNLSKKNFASKIEYNDWKELIINLHSKQGIISIYNKVNKTITQENFIKMNNSKTM